MIIALRMRVLWIHYDDDYYQEMFLTREQHQALLHDSSNGLNDVTGEYEHEVRYRNVRKAIMEKLA